MACTTCCHTCTSTLPGSTPPSPEFQAAPAHEPACTACTCRTWSCSEAATTLARSSISSPSSKASSSSSHSPPSAPPVHANHNLIISQLLSNYFSNNCHSGAEWPLRTGRAAWANVRPQEARTMLTGLVQTMEHGFKRVKR